MTRIFLILAALATAMLVLTFVMGLRIGDYRAAFAEVLEVRQRLIDEGALTVGGSHQPHPEVLAAMERLRPYRDRAAWHKNLALFTSLVVLLVNCVALTYFIGTGRWNKEVTLTYGLGEMRLAAATQLKRQTYVWVLAAITALLVLMVLGALADPAAGSLVATGKSSRAAEYHYVAAMLALGVIVWALLAEAFNIHRNSLLVEEMMNEVRRVRREKGLPVE